MAETRLVNLAHDPLGPTTRADDGTDAGKEQAGVATVLDAEV